MKDKRCINMEEIKIKILGTVYYCVYKSARLSHRVYDPLNNKHLTQFQRPRLGSSLTLCHCYTSNISWKKASYYFTSHGLQLGNTIDHYQQGSIEPSFIMKAHQYIYNFHFPEKLDFFMLISMINQYVIRYYILICKISIQCFQQLSLTANFGV